MQTKRREAGWEGTSNSRLGNAQYRAMRKKVRRLETQGRKRTVVIVGGQPPARAECGATTKVEERGLLHEAGGSMLQKGG